MSHRKPLALGPIIGGVTGGVVLLGVIIAVIVVIRLRRRNGTVSRAQILDHSAFTGGRILGESFQPAPPLPSATGLLPPFMDASYCLNGPMHYFTSTKREAMAQYATSYRTVLSQSSRRSFFVKYWSTASIQGGRSIVKYEAVYWASQARFTVSSRL